jgi:hypothetical protein
MVLGEPMSGWAEHMPIGMFLKSTPAASSLSAPIRGFTLAEFCAELGLPALGRDEPVPIDLFTRYGRWFQQELVPAVERHRVDRIARAAGGFELSLDSGEQLQARSIVVANGQIEFAHVPAALSGLVTKGLSASGPVSHTSEHHDLSVFRGRSVAVVGAGQSALESAALLQEAGAAVRVLVRASRVVWGGAPDGNWKLRTKPGSPLGPGWSLYALSRGPALVRRLPGRSRLFLVRTILGPSGAWWLRERVVDRVEIQTSCRLEDAVVTDGKVALRWSSPTESGRELAVDHVMAATGYRVDLDRLAFLSADLRAHLRRIRGSPSLSATFECSEPGLFFTGLSAAATFGPVMRFVCGAEFAARRISAALVERRARGGGRG